ncbi:DNA double-strand break repair nuclease NurA [Okeania sp.]|uniref:DNA double-strand break repair nuclease NurA n=1 Tax=Okeania sp. TaxID=3100323 RepID=UPI002B4ABC66|nr:DNA double-strand break repair nuclease NurA [Okeania sp.]MEB3340954.1 DNA double-strand break repair nuclease NurA [Okeania sp.]
MLDLTKLAPQMQGMSQHLTKEALAAQNRLGIAQQLLEEAKNEQDNLLELEESWSDRLLFNPAIPIESLDTFPTINPPPKNHTVFATDGSQIAPSHHEIAYCYLLNIGRVMLHYGESRYPLLDSIPEIFYEADDLYISRQWGIKTEEWMGYRRTISEALVLAELGYEWRQNNPNHLDFPILAMVDGSLIYWFLESLPSEPRDRVLNPILDAWNKLKLAGIPLIGYLSASRSNESLSFLRLKACIYDEPDCISHCPNVGLGGFGFTEKAPCQSFEPLRDVTFWGSILQPGQRSPLWQSSARILDLYGENTIYFCYVNVGKEVARIDMPEWVAEDEEMLELVLGMMLAQVQKGYGYPVALAEAHNQAVVRGGDRASFFALLEQEMIKAGLRNVGTSYKETRKRGSIA